MDARQVMVGFTTVHCCRTTIRIGANLGFDMTAVADALATLDAKTWDESIISTEEMHRVELTALSEECATVCDARHLRRDR